MSNQMSVEDFAWKVENEGGIYEGLSYGLRASDISTETQLGIDLARHWERLELAFLSAESIVEDVAPILERARNGESTE